MNNYRQPYYRNPASCGAGSQVSDASRRSCQNTATAPSSCTCGAQTNTECACEREDMPGFSLGMAYVPWQTWRKLYSPDEAIRHGTLFQELDMDFMGRRCN